MVASSRPTLVFFYSKDNRVDKKAFLQIARMVWLLNDHWDLQHRSYAMSVKQQVIMKVAGVMNFMFISNTKAPYVMICLFVCRSLHL